MKKTRLYLLIFCSFLLISCQTIKDGLSGKKSENSDEFLVKKKNPLVLPPKYMELPKPKDQIDEYEETIAQIEEETNIENLLKNQSGSEETQKKSYGDAEEFVLENLK
tara:strand:+ start:2625 stop:2948 length:324 start_codon:yes stop_codon:yes gene_type:complete